VTLEFLKEKTKEKPVPLEVHGKWIRFKEQFPYAGRKVVRNFAPCNLIVGVRGTGKSSLAENIATHFVDLDKPPEKTGKILDFFGSRDNENLAWLRDSSPYSEDVLLIVGDSVDISCSFDWKHLHDVHLSDFEKYRIITTCSSFFGDLKEEHHFIQEITKRLRQRTHWNEPWVLLIREAANLIYSRLSLGSNQAQAKSFFIYMLREARHSGLAVVADAIRHMAVDVDLRSISDYIFIKAPGVYGLPNELRFLYAYFEPYSIMKMPVHRFLGVTKRGSIFRGYFEYPWWHKEEKEDLIHELNIQIDYGEPINYGIKNFRAVSDFEHIEMIRLRIEEKNKFGRPLSLRDIGKRLRRGLGSVHKHCQDHNEDIDRVGVCQRCSRAHGKYAKVKVEL